MHFLGESLSNCRDSRGVFSFLFHFYLKLLIIWRVWSYVASDLDLHISPMTQNMGVGLIWVIKANLTVAS